MKKYTSQGIYNIVGKSDTVPSTPINPNTNIARSDFDDGFVFGSGTAAYQHEGFAAKAGRGKSIWDDYTLRTPVKIAGGTNGNVAADMYNRYKEDIKLMKNMGFDAYRFSISWSRLLPGGRPCLGVNKEGIDFYNDIINTLIANGIVPYVTLFHFDLPQCLELEYGGFLCPDKEITKNRIVNDFVQYAELCFWEFGDRVKNWVTINEPWSYAVHGYVDGAFPPSKNSLKAGSSSNNTSSASTKTEKQNKNNVISYRNSPHLNYDDQFMSNIENLKISEDTTNDCDSNSSSAKDTYKVTKNLLLCHAQAVDSYRKNFQDYQRGKVGISLNCHWFEPMTDDDEDIEASNRAHDFMLGWYLQPVLTGTYPDSMTDYAEPFSSKEQRLLKGSIDFLGLNYYTANYVADDCDPYCADGYYKDMQCAFYTERHRKAIGAQAGSPWLYIVPWGIKSLLQHISTTYDAMPDIYITENGVDEVNDWTVPASAACADGQRINYHADHLAKIKEAIDEDSTENLNVKGYFAWSWCDNFEWTEGYTVRFGIIYIDYMNELVRYPKLSAKWFSNLLNNKGSCTDKEEDIKK